MRFEKVRAWKAARLNDMEVALKEHVAPVLEGYMKQKHPWKNRTGNAERGLYARATRQGSTAFLLAIGHGVSYGTHLETTQGGRFAIVKPMALAHRTYIGQQVMQVWRRRDV